MSLLSQSDINAFTKEIRSVLGDDIISTDIVYRQTGTTVSTYIPSGGTIPSMWTESSVSAFKTTYTLEQMDLTRYEGQYFNSDIQTGDIKFIIMADDVSGVLSVDDMIRESSTTWQNSTTYEVKSVARDPLNICYFIQARNL
jgi:hypothetical protein